MLGGVKGVLDHAGVGLGLLTTEKTELLAFWYLSAKSTLRIGDNENPRISDLKSKQEGSTRTDR